MDETINTVSSSKAPATSPPPHSIPNRNAGPPLHADTLNHRRGPLGPNQSGVVPSLPFPSLPSPPSHPPQLARTDRPAARAADTELPCARDEAIAFGAASFDRCQGFLARWVAARHCCPNLLPISQRYCQNPLAVPATPAPGVTLTCSSGATSRPALHRVCLLPLSRNLLSACVSALASFACVGPSLRRRLKRFVQVRGGEATMVQQPVTPEANGDTSCGSLLRELQHIWDEVGESDVERDKMLLQLERECLEVYRRKVDAASLTRARLHQTLASAEAEFSALFSALGEPTLSQREKRTGTLKEQVASIGPQLEELRRRKEDRAQQFLEVKTEIAKICVEIAGNNGDVQVAEEKDLALRRLDEYHGQLATFQKEKSERLQKVLEYVDLLNQLCSVMGMDFLQRVTQVHVSLDDSQELIPKSISNETLDRLAKTIHSLQAEKKKRVLKIKELGTSMLELWSIMDTPVEEQQVFQHITCLIPTTEDDIVGPSCLSEETIERAQIEVERLSVLKKTKMKELVLKKRLELEEVCKSAHLEPDVDLAADKLISVIDSGIVDPAELLSNLDEAIGKAKEEVASRKDIMLLMEKWMLACEEEGWLEDYNKDENRFATKGAHLNLKRAEKARAAIVKLPAMVESLTQRTKSWEDERGLPFMFDGVRLLSMLNEYKTLREEKEEEKRRLRDHKKVREQMITEKETLFGSRPSPAKSAKKAERGPRMSNVGGATNNGHSTNGPAPAASRRLSLGNASANANANASAGAGATPGELSRNGSLNSRANGNGKEAKREATKPAAAQSDGNAVVLPENVSTEDPIGATEGEGSEPASPGETQQQ